MGGEPVGGLGVGGRSVGFNMVGGWLAGESVEDLSVGWWSVIGGLWKTCRCIGGRLPVVSGGPVGGLVVVCQWFCNTPELYLNFYFKITSKWQKYSGFLLNRRKTSTNIVLFWK